MSVQLIGALAARIHDRATATEGRRRTHQALRALEADGWRVLHGVAPGVEHLVIGPSGTYLLESRAWHGAVTVDHKGATITPGVDPSSAWTARGQHRSLPAVAAELGRGLTLRGEGPAARPRAVVVVWAPFPDGIAVSGGVTYVAGETLTDWLGSQPLAAVADPGAPPPRQLPEGHRDRAPLLQGAAPHR